MFSEYCSEPFVVEPVEVQDAAGTVTGGRGAGALLHQRCKQRCRGDGQAIMGKQGYPGASLSSMLNRWLGVA
jgi:hypothetical protein